MQSFDQSLFHLYQSGLITLEEALRTATNADEFRMRCAGIISADQALGSFGDINNMGGDPDSAPVGVKEAISKKPAPSTGTPKRGKA